MNIDRDKEWKERRAFNLAELEAKVAAIKAEIEEEAKPKKRLMTPAECAGKWLVKKDGLRGLIVGFGDVERPVILVASSTSYYGVDFFHSEGFKIADTATSEPYSLEVTE